MTQPKTPESDLDIVGIRTAEAEDRPFVLDSWLMSFRLSHFAGPIAMSRYRSVYEVEIADVITRPHCEVRVAFNTLSPDQLFGFICFEHSKKNPIIHYIYMKQPFRNRGIAGLLVKDAGINPLRKFLYTFRTPTAHNLTVRGSKFEQGKYSPNVIRFGIEGRETCSSNSPA